MEKAKYFGQSKKSRDKQLANLTPGRAEPRKPKTKFLDDERNLDVRYFLQHHFYLENKKPMRLETFQIQILDALYPKFGISKFDQAMIGLIRKSGKSTLISGLAIWHLCFANNPTPEVFIISGDLEQSRIIFDKSSKAVKRSPELRKVLRVKKSAIECDTTEGIYRSLSGDIDTSLGKSPSFLAMDEFSTSSSELYFNLISGFGARASYGEKCLAILIGTAGKSRSGPFYKMYQDLRAGKDSKTFFFWKEGKVASFTSEKWLNRMRKILPPQLFQRFMVNRWTSGEDSFITEEDLQRCLDPTLSPSGLAKEGVGRYCLGLDIGIVKDRSAIAVVHKLEDKIILDSLKVWQGSKDDPVLLSDLEEELRKANRLWNKPVMRVDPWQAIGIQQKLKREGLNIELFNFSSESLGALSANLYTYLHNGFLKIFRDERLISELLSVKMLQNSRGGFRIDHKSSDFSDMTIALGIAAKIANDVPSYSGGFKILLGDKREHKSLIRTAYEQEDTGHSTWGSGSPRDLLGRGDVREPRGVWRRVKESKDKPAQGRAIPDGGEGIAMPGGGGRVIPDTGQEQQNEPQTELQKLKGIIEEYEKERG